MTVDKWRKWDLQTNILMWMNLYGLAGILEYMNKQRGEPAKPVDKAALKYFLKEDDISVLGFFNTDTDPHLRIFQDACESLAVFQSSSC